MRKAFCNNWHIKNNGKFNHTNVSFKCVNWSHPSPMRDVWQVLGYMDTNIGVTCRVSSRDSTASNLLTLLGSQQSSLKRTKIIWNLFTAVSKTTSNDNWRIKKPIRCHLIFYCTSYRLNMLQALLCPSSGARDYDVVYHIGRVVLGLMYVGY